MPWACPDGGRPGELCGSTLGSALIALFGSVPEAWKWNSGAEAMFGYRAAEALGQTLDLIIPERLRARHWAGYHKAIATGSTRYARQVLAVPATRKDGASVSVEFTISLLHEPTGALLGPAAIVRDVTARWEQERALKKRPAALEAKTPSG
jgi:PAS domain S-box-containing protein